MKRIANIIQVLILCSIVPAWGQIGDWTLSYASVPGDSLFGPVWQEQMKGIFDFDGDGNGEFITLLASPYGGTNAKLVLLEAEADDAYSIEVLYSWTGLQSTQRSLAVGDLDGDGIDEIVACLETIEGVPGVHIFEFDPSTGSFPSTPTATWDPRAAGYIGVSGHGNRWAWEITPLIADIDSDGKNELISGAVGGTAIYELTTQDFGSPVWEAEYWDTTNVLCGWSFAVGDLDNDGKNELYDAGAWPQFGKESRDVFNIIEATGEDTYDKIAGLPDSLMPTAWAGSNGYTLVADLDGNGNEEFYQTDLSGNFWAFAPAGDLSSVDSSDFYLLNTFETGGWDFGDMVLGDQDSDGSPNFYIAGHGNVIDVAYTGGSATDPLSYTATTIFSDTTGLLPFRLAVGDIEMDGDNKREVVFISVNHDTSHSTVYVLESTQLGIGENTHILPNKYVLNQNYPNPFNPITQISYSLSEAISVQVIVYSLLGHEIVSLVNEFQTPGNYTVEWSGKDNQGRGVASGVYLYELRAGNFVVTKKMVYLR